MFLKRFSTLFILLILIGLGANAVSAENPFPILEGPFLSVYIAKDLNGYVKTKDCDKCKVYGVKITPDVKVLFNSEPAKLADFILTDKKPMFIEYDIKKKKAITIGW